MVDQQQVGGLPSGWVIIKLGDVSKKIGSGATPRGGKEVYLLQGDTAFIRSQNIYNNFFSKDGIVYLTKEQSAELKNVEVLPEDILLNITGDSVARVCRAPNNILPARVNQHVAIIRTKSSKINSRFLGYFLVAPEMQNHMLSLSASGATRKALTKGMIENFSIICPPLPEQKAIAAILGALDDKIEANRKMNATLEGIARALFKSWFVDFDPVKEKAGRTKAEGHPPPSEHGGLPADLNALFPDCFTDSPLGEIPMGWEAGKIEDILERKTIQKRYKKNQVTDDGSVPVFEQGANILLGYHNENPDLDATPDDPAFIFGDHTCVTKLSTEPFSISENVIALKGKIYPTFWVYYAIQGKQEFEEYRRHWMELIVKEVILPPITVCVAFSNIIRCLTVKRTANERQNKTLATLRDTLLPKLISGQIRVKDAEKLVEGV